MTTGLYVGTHNEPFGSSQAVHHVTHPVPMQYYTPVSCLNCYLKHCISHHTLLHFVSQATPDEQCPWCTSALPLHSLVTSSISSPNEPLTTRSKHHQSTLPAVTDNPSHTQQQQVEMSKFRLVLYISFQADISAGHEKTVQVFTK